MNVLRPTSLDEACQMMAQDPTPNPIAGGTDLLVCWPQRDTRGWTLLDLSLLHDELARIEEHADTFELGALTTYWDVMQSASLREAFPMLHEAARQVGAIQIQTRGTWAGNIANGSPAADGVPVLMAYDASVVLQSVDGRREVPLAEYYTGYRASVRTPHELIVAIRFPKRVQRHQFFHKIGARRAQAITKAGVAIAAPDDGWRVVVNSVAPTVCRCPALEAELNRGSLPADARAVEGLLASDIAPIDDLRSTAHYRQRALANVVWHELRGVDELTLQD